MDHFTLFERLRRSLFDVAGPSASTRAIATATSSAGPVATDLPNRYDMGSVESSEPEPKRLPGGSAPRSSSNEPAHDAGEVGATETPSSRGERRGKDRRQSKRRTADAEPDAPPPPPPAPPIEVPTSPAPFTVGRTPVDLAESAALAKDIFAANEDQPPPSPGPRRDARPPAPVGKPVASLPEETDAARSGDRADEESESGPGDDAPVTPDFFASTRGKKRFRRE